MALIQVERKNNGDYRALKNGRTVATGETQGEAAESARKKYPDDTIEAERVRFTSQGKPDKWRWWPG